MNVFYTEDALNHQHAYVALGVFDGVHRAHAELITCCKKAADQAGRPCFVYTYANQTHSKKFEQAGGALTTVEEKIECLEKLGISNVILMTFTQEYRSATSLEFLQRLCKDERVEAIFCGLDYRFGYDAVGQGNVDFMRKQQRALGYTLHAIDDIILDGAPISSTRVRAALAEGDCSYARRLLGYPYTVGVEQIQGDAGSWPSGKAVIPDATYRCLDKDGSCLIQIQSRQVRWLDRKPAQQERMRVQFLEKVK